MNPVSSSATFSDLVKSLIGLMNAIIPTLIGFAIVFFFIGLIRYIYNAGDAKGRSSGRTAIIWGLIGLFVIFSLWGVLHFLEVAFFPAATPAQVPFGVVEHIVFLS